MINGFRNIITIYSSNEGEKNYETLTTKIEELLDSYSLLNDGSSSGSLNREIKNYATVNYEKGYKRIGIIYQERIFTEAILSSNGDEITRGDFDTIRNVMNQEIEVSGGNIDTFNLGDGFSIFATI